MKYIEISDDWHERVRAAIGDDGSNDDEHELLLEALEAPTGETNQALWFDPQSIRDHFERDDWVAKATDEQLADVGQACLQDDHLYDAFRRALLTHVDEAMHEEATP